MPDVSDGPYILLSDLDIEGKRTTNSVNGEGSMVKANQSMLADHWDTQEYVDVINGSYSSEEWLYQDVYILKNEDMVDRFSGSSDDRFCLCPVHRGLHTHRNPRLGSGVGHRTVGVHRC